MVAATALASIYIIITELFKRVEKRAEGVRKDVGRRVER